MAWTACLLCSRILWFKFFTYVILTTVLIRTFDHGDVRSTILWFGDVCPVVVNRVDVTLPAGRTVRTVFTLHVV